MPTVPANRINKLPHSALAYCVLLCKMEHQNGTYRGHHPCTYLKMKEHRVLNGFAYFLVCDERFVKIGRSTAPEARLRTLQQCIPYTLRLARQVPQRECSEAAFLKRFEALHVRGEWFDYRDALRVFLDTPTNVL